MLSDAVPVLVSVTDCEVLVVPVFWLPKERLEVGRLTVGAGDDTAPDLPSATVCQPPAAIAVTPLKPAGIVVWPKPLYPHATTVPSLFKATV